jgi:chloramphenicol-sensitive protein RarD
VTPPEHDEAAVRSGIVAGVVCFTLWGLLTVYWKQITRFDPFELVGWRIVSSATIMAIVLTVTRRWPRLKPVIRDRRLLGRVVLAALLLATNWTTYVWAVVHGHVIDTALGYFLGPLGTIAIGVWLFGEPLRRLQKVAVGFAVAAVVVLTAGYGRFPVVAVLLATSWMLYGILKRQVPLNPIESMSAESFIALVPAIVTVIALTGNDGSVAATAGTREALMVAGTGIVTVVPLMLFAWSAQRVPFTLLGPMQYVIPSINFLLGWAVYHEEMTSSRLAGFALVWAGLVLITVDTVHDRRTAGLSTVPAVR